jgi:hypothetical protein
VLRNGARARGLLREVFVDPVDERAGISRPPYP